MLSSCGSKHKNYISKHPLALEKTVQGLVDDLGDLIIKYKDSHPKGNLEIFSCLLWVFSKNLETFDWLAQLSSQSESSQYSKKFAKKA